MDNKRNNDRSDYSQSSSGYYQSGNNQNRNYDQDYSQRSSERTYGGISFGDRHEQNQSFGDRGYQDRTSFGSDSGTSSMAHNKMQGQYNPSWQSQGSQDRPYLGQRNYSSSDRYDYSQNRNSDEGRFDYNRSRADFGSSSFGRDSGYQDYSNPNRYESSGYGAGYSRHADKNESWMESAKDSIKDFFGKGPKGYKRSDERIKEDVCEALYRHPRIDASEIDVTVNEGTVTLSGTVDDRRTKRLVEDVIENCSGVNNVTNQLIVGKNFGQQSQMSSSSSASVTPASTSSSGRTKSVQ